MSTFKHIYNEKLRVIAERAKKNMIMRGEDYNKALKPHFDNIIKYAKEGLPDDEQQIFEFILATIKGMQEDAKKKFPKEHVMGYRDQQKINHGVDAIFRFVENKKGVSRKVKKIVKKIQDQLWKISSIQIFPSSKY